MPESKEKKESPYVMTVGIQIVEHLGLNLYSNTSAVLSEGVANAWDADATEVDITVNPDKIEIKDNGVGMTKDDINNRYLFVGYKKRKDDKAFTPKFKRPVMGRKGIGKLSLLSIAETISIYSFKGGEKNALKISAQKLKETVSKEEPYYPEALNIETKKLHECGTKIILTGLKKQRTTGLDKKLRKRLARRFSIIGDEYNFKVTVNNDPVTISDRDYLPKAQYLWIYATTSEYIDVDSMNKKYLGSCSAKLKDKFRRDNKVNVDDKEYNISGWIATAQTPGDLKDDENLNRIVVMVRGKMAKDDILNEIGTTSLYSKYVFGEIHADFLDLDDLDDIATSSRQDFFDDDERYAALKKFIELELANIRSVWESERNESGVEEICKYEVLKEWYNDLGSDDKKSAKQFFGKINQLAVDDNQKKELFKNGVLAFESLKLNNELSELESISSDDLSSFLKIASRLDGIEASHYLQIVRSRLSVITRMKDIIEEGTLEKVIQEHLANNLWLLDPSWDRGVNLPVVEQTIKKQFEPIINGLTQQEKDARLDIRYQKTSKKHVVLELKKGDRKVRYEEISAQINKYYAALMKIFKTMDSSTDFEIIVLLGKRFNANDSDIEKTQIESLKSFKTRIMYYEELIYNAETLYRDFIDTHRNLAKFDNYITRIEKS